MRCIFILLAAAAALAAGAPSAPAADACEGAACGVPSCGGAVVRARPGMARDQSVRCGTLISAALARAPAHGVVTDVKSDWDGLSFRLRPDADAPASDSAIFTLTGPGGTADVEITIQLVPLSENSAPICQGDRITQRSDGSGPVDLFMHPFCYDADDDDFVMYGAGPGVHPSSPKPVRAGSSESNWSYRTATFSGAETGIVYAIDSLGARSADAELDVTVGPGIDRMPVCGGDYGWGETARLVYTRPGAVRRFAIGCQDDDGDAFEPVVTSPPQQGIFAAFLVEPPSSLFPGYGRYIDATYVPAGPAAGRDEFEVQAQGPRGAGPPARIAMVPRLPPENAGGGCGWSPAAVTRDAPGTVELTCEDDDGDPLTVIVTGAPLHGTAGVPVVTIGRFGSSRISIPYVPAPGYSGYDRIKVLISDGVREGSELTLDINVSEYGVGTDAFWGQVPPSPELLPPPPPPPPSAPLTPAAQQKLVAAYARRLLGTRSVERIDAPGTAQVWAPVRLSRRALLRSGRSPGMLVLCPAGCGIRSGSSLGVRARATRRRSALTVAAGQSQIIWLVLDRPERSHLRRTRAPRAGFDVRLRQAGARLKTIRRSIRIR